MFYANTIENARRWILPVFMVTEATIADFARHSLHSRSGREAHDIHEDRVQQGHVSEHPHSRMLMAMMWGFRAGEVSERLGLDDAAKSCHAQMRASVHSRGELWTGNP